MRALVIDSYNAPLQLRDMPTPALRDGEMLVEVHAAGVNPVDYKTAQGGLKTILELHFPQVLGNELSGIVKQLGNGVTKFKVGDEVFARVAKDRLGTFAEEAVVHENHAAKKPSNLTHVEAASIPLVTLTSWQALFELGELKSGQSVLIHAGAGGVGTIAIQLAHHAGAKVFTTASAKNHALVKELGADVAIDYTKERFEDVAKDVDVVYDLMGEDTLLRSFESVKRGGRVVSIAALPDEIGARELKMNPVIRLALRFMNRKITAAAKRRGVTYRYLFMRPDGAQLAQIGALLEKGELKPVVGKVFPLEKGAEAFAEQETGRARGKLVLQVR